MNAHEVAQIQEMAEELIQPGLIAQQQMIQGIAEQVLQPALIQQQKAIQRAVRPAMADSLIQSQQLAEQILQPTIAQQQQIISKIAERTLQPTLFAQERALQQAVKPAIHRDVVGQLSLAIKTVEWADELLDSPEMEGTVPDFQKATRRNTPTHSEAAGTPSVDWGLTHSIGFLITTASYMIDRVIEQKGLRDAITEVKRRRWILRLVLTLLAINYYSQI